MLPSPPLCCSSKSFASEQYRKISRKAGKNTKKYSQKTLCTLRHGDRNEAYL